MGSPARMELTAKTGQMEMMAPRELPDVRERRDRRGRKARGGKMARRELRVRQGLGVQMVLMVAMARMVRRDFRGAMAQRECEGATGETAQTGSEDQ